MNHFCKNCTVWSPREFCTLQCEAAYLARNIKRERLKCLGVWLVFALLLGIWAWFLKRIGMLP